MMRRIGPIVGVVLTVCLVAAGRLWTQGRNDYAAAELALSRGDGRAAQVFLEHAARTYFPGNVPARRAFNALRDLAAAWAHEGKTVHALSAAESLRGILITTGADAALPTLAREAQAGVVGLRARLDRGGGSPADPVAPGEVQRYSAALQRPRSPARFGTMAGILLFIAGSGSLVALARAWGRSGFRGGWGYAAGWLLLLAAALAVLARV
jgi:hypothetical protein